MTDTMNDRHETQLAQASPAALAAAEAAKSRIQAAYTIALHNRRNADDARRRILSACKRPRFAEKVEYSKPVGGSRITGASVRFAELALREWGNVLSDINAVYEDEGVRRIKIYITDLETNTQFTKEISVSKTVERKSSKGREVVGERVNTYGDSVFIVKATDDELANKEAALISKALRNEGLRLIPQDIIEEALEVAKETLASGIKEDPDSHKRKVLEAFADMGITAKDIGVYLGHSTENISANEITDLRAVYRAIKDGEAKWADYAEKAGTGGFETVDDDEGKDAKPAKKAANKSESKPAEEAEGGA